MQNNTEENFDKLTLLKKQLSFLSHDMRTSLTANKWILSMILDGDTGEINSEQENFLKKALDSNERLIKLVNNLLLDHSKESENIIRNADLIKMIEDVLFIFKPESQKNNIECLFVKEEKSIFVKIDENNLRIVLQNLLDNAIKYSNRGGKVLITLENEKDFVILKIKDSGIGIPEKDLPKIFTESFRSQNAQKKEKSGFGMGLFIVKEILLKNNCEIKVESREGSGTSFEIKFKKE